MGIGIVYGFVSFGYFIVLVDINVDLLFCVRDNIDKIFSGGVVFGKVFVELVQVLLVCLVISGDFGEVVCGVNWLVEMVFEWLEVKKVVVMQVEFLLVDDVIIVINIFVFSVIEIVVLLVVFEWVIGMYFFNFVYKMKLVELVCGLVISDEVLVCICVLCDVMGKILIVVNEFFGLIISCMFVLFGNEVMYML